jgi:hypothetical protein
MGTHGHVTLQRTHLMLTQEQYTLLKAEAEVAGLSVGELVRRALDRVYRPRARLRVRGWEISFAVWRRPDAAVVARRLQERARPRMITAPPPRGDSRHRRASP